MNKEYYENLVRLYRKKDALRKEINNATWDDPFTQQPECWANERNKLVSLLKEVEEQIDTMNRQQK